MHGPTLAYLKRQYDENAYSIYQRIRLTLEEYRYPQPVISEGLKVLRGISERAFVEERNLQDIHLVNVRERTVGAVILLGEIFWLTMQRVE